MKKLNFISMLLVALLCSANMWGEDLTLTVMDDDYFNQYVPVDGYGLDASQHNQFLLLGSELSAMNGCDIKGLKFYLDKTGHAWYNSSNIPNVTFRLAEVSNTSLSSQITVDESFTQVYSGSISFSFKEKEWNITFDEPYSYNGGNLLIDIQTTAGSYIKKNGSTYMRFYTSYVSGRAMRGSSTHSYCPKTTFIYEPAAAGSCAKPKTLVASSILPDGATFTWAQGEEENEYQYACVAQGATPESWTDVEGTERTLTLHGLTAGTAYDLYVRSNCGTEQSAGAKVSFTPTCPAPTAPVVSGISATGATLSWTAAAGISKYQYIVVGRDATEDWTSPTLVEGATTASLTALTAGTNYDVYVRSYFNETTVSASVKVEFATPCVAMSAISDFNGTFESEIAGSGLMPNCWEAAATYTYENYYSGSTIYPCVKETYSSNTGDKCLAFYGGTNTTKNIALLPVFTEALNTLAISFYYKNGSSYGGTFSLGYYKNGVFTAYEGAANLTVKTSYTQFEFAIPNIAEADGARLAIQYSGGSYSYEAYMDDITITLTPSCAKPSVVTASNIVYDGATIDWTENGSAEEWKVQYSTDNTNWETKNVTAHPYELRGLTTGTPYYVQVISVCGSTDESPAVAAASTFTPAYIAPTDLAVSSTTTTTATFSWTANSGETAWTVQYKKSGDADWTTVENVTVNPYTLTGLTSGSSYQVKVAAGTLYTAAVDFNTECEAKTIPFEEYFDALNCWSMLDKAANTGLDRDAFIFNYNTNPPQYLVSPELVTEDKQVTVAFEYRAKSNSYEESFQVGYSTTTNDVAAFTWSDEVKYKMTSYETYSEVLPAGVKFIAIKYTANDKYALYIDNFSVTEYVAPSCAAPTTLTVTDITTNSASVSWTSEAASFALEYKKTSDEQWTAATGTIASPFALEGLTPNETEYTVRVKAICGENNESEWTELTAPFKTQCTVKTVTKETAWTENFEALTANQAPACWDDISSLTSSAYMQVNAAAAKDGSLGLQIYVSGTHSDIVKLPLFNEETKNLKLSFDYKNYGETSNYGELEVGYYASNGYTTVATMNKTTAFAASGEIVMPNDAPADARIAFRVLGIKNNYNSHAYIDNLVVSRKPACAIPTNLQAVATSTGATLTWTAGDEETQWNIRYSVKDADSWTVLENKTSGFALTGLEIGTEYEVQVQAYCDEDHQSAWTTSAIFTPVCGAAPTSLTVSARSTNAATLTWEGTESAFKLQTSLDGETWEDAVDVNAKTYDLTALTAGTTYYVRVQNACGGEYATTSFTTWCGLQDAASLPLNITAFTAVPDCWEMNFVGENSGIANNKIFFYGDAEQMAVLPAYDIELNKLSVTFGFSTTASLEFGYLDEPNGTFHAFASQPTTGVELNLQNEPAAAKYIAIRYTATSAYASGSISSVLLRKTPTCEKPVDVIATPAVGAASIDWTSEATAWNLQYKLASASDWTDAAVTAKPFELTSLAQGATYKVRVQANCGDELSDWSDEITFTTNCSSIDALPYYADFTQALSSCWVVFAQNENYYKPTVNTAMQQLTMNGGKEGASNNVVAMPPFSADLTNAVISLEYSCSTGANYAQLEVGYLTDKADAATFQALQTLDRTGSWTEARVAAATIPANAYIAFRYAGASSHGDAAIRNLRVIEALTLADNTDNTSLLAANTGKTLDVQINRTFVCADYYNTLCLPFDLPTLDGTPLEGGELWAFKYATVDQTTDELLFRIIEAESIEAGVPYLIAWPDGDNIVNPLFKNVTISATTGQNIGDASVAQLCGIIEKPVVFVAHDRTKLFLAENNRLYWWDGDADSQLNNFRAYFLVNTNSGANNAPRHGMRARIIKEEQVITGVEEITNDELRMTNKILRNGQLLIIHNGNIINVLGQPVR